MRKPIVPNRSWWVLPLLALTAACQTPGRACLDVRADVSMNLYEGKPHATKLQLYPLADSLGFVQTPVDELLKGARPAGMTLGDPVEVTIFPGQTDLRLDREFPEDTVEIGVLADYYRKTGDAEGTRTLVLRATCGRRTPRIYMSVRELRTE